MAEEEIILRFEGQDDVSPVIERIAALLDNTVVSVDDLVAAGFRMEDITAALDGIAGAAGTAGTGLAGMAAMTKESALALGQANDIAGQMATVVDGLTQASLSDAQAFSELTAQTRMLSDAQSMAFAALDRATASETAQEQAMAGLGQAITDVNDQINLFAESTTASTDRAAAYTMAIGRAATETSAFAQEQLSLAERMSAGSDTIGMLSDKVTQLAVAEGLAVDITAPLAESFTALSGALDVSARATQSLAEAQAMSFRASADLQAQLAAMRMGLTGTADDLAILRVAFETTFNSAALQGAGYSIEAINKAMSDLLAGADPAAVALELVASRLDDVAAAALVADDNLATDAIAMVEAADAARILAEAKTQAARAAYELAVAEGVDAATVGALAVASDAAASAQARLAGTEEEAGAAAEGEGASFGISKFMLFMLGMMALSVGKQFIEMGINFDDTMTIIQGKTMASDQQIQQWTATMQDMATQSGFTMDVLAQGLDTVTAAGFRATDATDVLEQGMRLARATGGGLVESTNLLTASLDAYGQTSASAAGYAQLLFVAIANGKQNVQELTQMLGSTIDTAAAAGISFQDLVNAETLFSRASVDSSIAARDFQTFIAAIGADSNMTAAQVAKLSQTFDSAKFATLDWAGKLEMLGKISNGDVREFNQLIGGAGDAKNALDILGISTDQLAKNAKAAGLSFDPILYDSLKTASEKLFYLTQVSGGSEANLKKLTVDGVHPLNDSLASLDLKVSDVAAQFAKTHPAFDQATFDSLDLKDKLLMLWDAVGHNTTAFAPFIGGMKNLGVAAGIMGVDLNNTSTGADHLGTAVQTAQAHLHNFDDASDNTANKTLPNLDASYNKTTSDMKSSTDKLGAAASALSVSFNKLVDPALAGFFTQLATAADWLSKNLWLVQGASHGVESQDSLLVISLSWVVQAFINAAKWTYSAGVAVGNYIGQLANGTTAVQRFGQAQITTFDNWTNEVIGKVGQFIVSLVQDIVNLWNGIKNAFSSGFSTVEGVVQSGLNTIIQFFEQFSVTIVGASIIPDMVNRITQVFSAGGAAWNAAISAALSTLEATFSSDMQSIQSTVQSIMASIGSTMASLAQSAVSRVQAAWNALPGIASSIFNSVISTIGSVLSSGVGIAFSAAQAIGQGVVNGLNSMLGAIAGAAGNIAATVMNFLPRSPAKEGPLKDLDKTMPAMMDMLTRGMQDGTSKLQAASLQMAASVGSGFSMNTPVLGGGGIGGGNGNSSVLLSQILTTLQEIARQQGSTNVTSGPSVTNMFSGTLMPGISQTQMWQIINAVGGMMMESGARGATQQGAR